MDAHATPITPAAINNNTTLADATAIINDNNTPMITTDPAQCRICRGEATDDQPLFHPCLCAGSIKHVHQDCLEQWLKRSGKRQCELCKRPFRFTAVYAEDMPQRGVAVRVVLRHVARAIPLYIERLIKAFALCVAIVATVLVTAHHWRWLFGGRSWPVVVESQEIAVATTATATTVESEHVPLLLHNFTFDTASAADVRALMVWFYRHVVVPWMPGVSDVADLLDGMALLSIYFLVPLTGLSLYEFLSGMLVRREPRADVEVPLPVVEPGSLDVGALAMLEEVSSDDEDVAEITSVNGDNNEHGGRTVGDALREEAAMEAAARASRPPSTLPAFNADQVPLTPAAGTSSSSSSSSKGKAPMESTVGGDENHRPENAAPVAAASAWKARSLAGATDFRVPSAAWGIGGDFTMDPFNSARTPSATSSTMSLASRPQSAFAPRDSVSDDVDEDQVPDVGQEVVEAAPVGEAAAVDAPMPAVDDGDAEAGLADGDNGDIDDIDDNDGILVAIGNLDFRESLSYTLAMLLLSTAATMLGVYLPWMLGKATLFALDVVRVMVVHEMERLRALVAGEALGEDWSVMAWPAFGLDYPAKESMLIVAFGKVLPTVILGYATALLFFYLAFLIWTDMERQSVALGHEQSGDYLAAKRMFNGVFLSTKIVVLIAVELLVFPLFCGVLVDLFTLPLFYDVGIRVTPGFSSEPPQPALFNVLGYNLDEAVFSIMRFLVGDSMANVLLAPILHPLVKGVSARVDFHMFAPTISTFLHWFVGSLLMFYVSAFIGMMRKFMRPGVLWFIRDPSETDFHPLQEMVERPLKSQLSKISVSFVVYTVITFGTLAPLFYGTLAMNWLAVVAVNAILWNLPLADLLTVGNEWMLLPCRSSLSPFKLPVEIIVAHVIVPLLIRFANPSANYERACRYLTHHMAKATRLRSFLFGNRFLDDERGVLLHPTMATGWKGKKDSKMALTDPLDPREYGTFLRVLAQDNITTDRLLKRVLRVDMSVEASRRQARSFNVVIEAPMVANVSAKSIDAGAGVSPERASAPAATVVKEFKLSEIVTPPRRGFTLGSMLDGWSDPFLVPVSGREFKKLHGLTFVDGPLPTNATASSAPDPLTADAQPRPPSAETRVAIRPRAGVTTATAAAVEAMDGANALTTVVFAPPRLKRRVLSFVILLWSWVNVMHAMLLFVPLVVGRLVSSVRVLDMDALRLGDTMAYVLGVFVLSLAYTIATGMRNLARKGTSAFGALGMATRHLVKDVYVLSVVLVVLPWLFQILLDRILNRVVVAVLHIVSRYFQLPLTALGWKDALAMESLELSRLTLFTAPWAEGLILLPLTWNLLRMLNDLGLLTDAVSPYAMRVFRLGRRLIGMEVGQVTLREVHAVLWPLALLDVCVMSLPTIVEPWLSPVRVLPQPHLSFLLHTLLVPALFAVWSMWRALESVAAETARAVDRIREAEYRVGMQLHNAVVVHRGERMRNGGDGNVVEGEVA